MAKYKAYSEYKDSGVEWLGEIPIDWSLKKAKYIFQKVQRPPRNIDSVVTAFRDGQVTLRTNRRIDGFTNSIKEIGYQGVRSGDLMIHAMDGFAGAIGISDSDGKCSPVCSVCIPWIKQSVNMLFYGYLVRQLAVTDFILSLAKGIRERSTEFRFSEFSGLVLAIPSKDEQDKIVAFLKHETQKIDRLISKQQQLIELLKEKRHAVISHVVTKGLNPNVPMKDSGVDWLGEIPINWDICKLKHLATIKNGQDYKLVQTEYGYPVMGSGGHFAFSSKFMYDKPSVLLGRKGTIDKPLYIDKPFWTVDTMYYTELHNTIDAKYLYYQAVTIQFSRYSTNTALPSMTQENLSNYYFSVPKLEIERASITNFLDSETAKIDNLIEKQQQIIQLLQERRTALISAAVTGKIDVRSWVAPGEQAKAESPAEAFA